MKRGQPGAPAMYRNSSILWQRDGRGTRMKGTEEGSSSGGDVGRQVGRRAAITNARSSEFTSATKLILFEDKKSKSCYNQSDFSPCKTTS